MSMIFAGGLRPWACMLVVALLTVSSFSPVSAEEPAAETAVPATAAEAGPETTSVNAVVRRTRPVRLIGVHNLVACQHRTCLLHDAWPCPFLRWHGQRKTYSTCSCA